MGYDLSARICLGVQLYDETADYSLDDVIVNGKTPEDWYEIAKFIECASPFSGKVGALRCGWEGENGIVLAIKDTIYTVDWGEVKNLNSLLTFQEEQWKIVFELRDYLIKCGITPLDQGILLSAYYG